METKICKKCGRELPIECFSKCSRNKDGLQTYCKECNKHYYANNREKKLEYKKKWYQEKQTYILEYHKQYYQDNREKELEKMKRWRARNLEYDKEHSKQYRATLRGYCFKVRNNNINSDRKYGRIGDELPPNYPTVEDYMELLQLPDFYDGKQYDFTEMGLDRIDNTKPHTLDNVVPCTAKHNIQRHLIPFDVFCAKFNKNQPIEQDETKD